MDPPDRPAPVPADQETSADPDAPAPYPEQTGRSVEGAPRPGQASGVAVAEPHPEYAVLWVPRTLLFLPRLALEVVDAPVRGFLWTYDRFQLRDRAYRIFFNEEGTVGLFPIALVESEFGVNLGARFISRDTFGRGEGLSARVSFGGRFNQIYTAELDSGDRFGDRFQLSLGGEYDVRPKDKFFGIGNADAVPDAENLDAFDRSLAVKSRFRQRVARATLAGQTRLWERLFVTPSVAYSWRSFRDSTAAADEEILTDNFMTGTLVGFEDGVSNVYPEVELRWDARESPSEFEPREMYSTGWLLGVFAGYRFGVGDDDRQYARYGLDVQRFFRLDEGPRLLALRAYAEGVTGELDEVPFVELPELGGALLLRGYDRDRFHDRALALVSAEYQWDLTELFSAILFVDAGRVHPSWSDFTLDDHRVGYGGAIELHTRMNFIARANIETSIDGGLFFNLSFDPVYDPKARAERK